MQTSVTFNQIVTLIKQLSLADQKRLWEWFRQQFKDLFLPISSPPPTKVMTAKDLLESDLIGMWADRIDITDSLTFARQLRHQAETREPYDFAGQ